MCKIFLGYTTDYNRFSKKYYNKKIRKKMTSYLFGKADVSYLTLKNLKGL